MRDVGSHAGEGRVDRGYVGFALEVIRKLSAMRNTEDTTLLDDLTSRLYAAVTAPSTNGLSEVIAEFSAARISAKDLTLNYIPAVARRLGRDWENDRISFTDVTIGATRLQTLLREMAAGWTADGSSHDGQGAILMIVPLGEQHTLGSLVAATWLRRNGVSVSVQIAPSPQDLGRLLQGQRFDAVFVSVGSDYRLDACAKLVRTLRALSPGPIPVVVGGALAAHKREDLLSIGADSVTTDLAEALEVVGLGLAKRRLHAR
jgi:methylmalonyl-CoA mutase cobalamin-binding subunit